MPAETQPLDEVRGGATDGERSDEYSEGHSPPGAEPSRHRFETARIDPGEGDPGHEAQRHGPEEVSTPEKHQQRVGHGTGHRRNREQASGRNRIHHPRDCKTERTNDKTQLNRQRQIRRFGTRQLPCFLQRTHYGRGTEPKRQDEQLADRNGHQGGALFARRHWRRHRFSPPPLRPVPRPPLLLRRCRRCGVPLRAAPARSAGRAPHRHRVCCRR